MAKDLVYDRIQIVDFTEGATHYHVSIMFFQSGEIQKPRQLKLQTIFFMSGKK